jgi:hypothetical protein
VWCYAGPSEGMEPSRSQQLLASFRQGGQTYQIGPMLFYVRSISKGAPVISGAHTMLWMLRVTEEAAEEVHKQTAGFGRRDAATAPKFLQDLILYNARCTFLDA